MGIKEWFHGKKLKEEETIKEILKKTGRIKELEKKYLKLDKSFRGMQTDMKRMATRITNLELKGQMEKKR